MSRIKVLQQVIHQVRAIQESEITNRTREKGGRRRDQGRVLWDRDHSCRSSRELGHSHGGLNWNDSTCSAEACSTVRSESWDLAEVVASSTRVLELGWGLGDGVSNNLQKNLSQGNQGREKRQSARITYLTDFFLANPIPTCGLGGGMAAEKMSAPTGEEADGLGTTTTDGLGTVTPPEPELGC